MGKIKALYHDFDPFKCAVVREAIKAGAITDGEVICGDIKELKASDLVGFKRIHFFCGGGFWDVALNQAGWGDEEVWSGSCPCPSFSEAGKGEGFDDDRHLWPEWDTLIGQRKPSVIFGEQSGAAIGFGWLDLVCGNLEAKGYAVAAAVLGAHSVGAPHRRQRLYFCADTDGIRRSGRRVDNSGDAESGRIEKAERSQLWKPTAAYGNAHCVTDTECDGGRPNLSEREEDRRTLDGRDCSTGDGPYSDGRDTSAEREQRSREQRLLSKDCGISYSADSADGDRWSGERGTEEGTRQDGERRRRPASSAAACNSSDTEKRGLAMCGSAPVRSRYAPLTGESGNDVALGVDLDAKCQGLEGHFGDVREWRGPGWLDPLTARSVAEAGATRGFWRDCDWWYGRDGKYRPIKPGIFPLAARYPARVGLLRTAGDSIVIPQAVAFIKAYLAARRGNQ